jgi:hypothetical protein
MERQIEAIGFDESCVCGLPEFVASSSKRVRLAQSLVRRRVLANRAHPKATKGSSVARLEATAGFFEPPDEAEKAERAQKITHLREVFGAGYSLRSACDAKRRP